MNEVALTHEQRVEAVRQLEDSRHPQARMILECLDRLLSGEDVERAMDSLASETEPIIGHSTINSAPYRKYIIDYPNTPYARVRGIELKDADR